MAPGRAKSRLVHGETDISPRELEVIELVVDGYTNGEIGELLGLSVRTVQEHVASARRKLGARSRTQLAVMALRSGLVPMEKRPE